MNLRDYQFSILNNIINSTDDVVFQLETGGGKTAIINELAKLKPTISIAHRNMLIEQISNTHSRSGLSHKVIGNQQITKRCQLYQRHHGGLYGGDVHVASVQSLVSWYKRGKLAIDRLAIEQVIIDEAHHLAEGNMWAEVRNIFKNARFIGATATPCRLDGRGLHKDSGGIFDRLVQAEQLAENGTQWLIGNGYLCDYEYWCPPSSIDFGKLKMRGADYTLSSIDEACGEQVVGEVIENYKKFADNKTAIVYCARIERAEQIANRFKRHGYSATHIASTLGLAENMRRLDAFKSGDVKVLVNVEMATEGFDLPAAQCLIMLRATASLVLFKQMIGRVMRPKTDGSKAVIIDHVSNVWKHGLPDDDIVWTLTGVPKNRSEKVGACGDCGHVFNIYLKKCPQCDSLNPLLSRPKCVNELENLGVIDAELVQKVRHVWKQQEIDAERQRVKSEHELSLKTKVHTPRWRDDYGKDSIGQLCTKIVDWFLLNVAETDLSITIINQFTTGNKPPLDFWSSNFNINSLKTSEPQKCKKVLLKWLKSKQ